MRSCRKAQGPPRPRASRKRWPADLCLCQYQQLHRNESHRDYRLPGQRKGWLAGAGTGGGRRLSVLSDGRSEQAFPPRLLRAVERNALVGQCEAYAIDAATGKLQYLNTVSMGATGPATLAVSPDGRYAVVTNYYYG